VDQSLLRNSRTKFCFTSRLWRLQTLLCKLSSYWNHADGISILFQWKFNFPVFILWNKLYKYSFSNLPTFFMAWNASVELPEVSEPSALLSSIPPITWTIKLPFSALKKDPYLSTKHYDSEETNGHWEENFQYFEKSLTSCDSMTWNWIISCEASRWPRGTLCPQKLALPSPTSDGRSVVIVRSRTQAKEFSFLDEGS
jgi:hypothetical protein